MENTPVHCSNCDYVDVLVHRPVTLIYQLPNGQEFRTGRRLCWCNTCGGIRNVEPDFLEYFDVDQRIAELKNSTSTIKSKTHGLINKLLGGPDQSSDEAELQQLDLGRKIARARESGPRCLDCGESDVEDLADYTHTCGGRLIPTPNEDDGARISYVPETIYLDYEGRKLSSPRHIDPYAQFAQHAKIECVMKGGIFALLYVHTLFDGDDFSPLLGDKERFRKFAKIIELRIKNGDFDNPLSGFTESQSQKQIDSISEAVRAIVVRDQKIISKWLRSQIMVR